MEWTDSPPRWHGSPGAQSQGGVFVEPRLDWPMQQTLQPKDAEVSEAGEVLHALHVIGAGEHPQILRHSGD
eukprot:10965180-Prorocentrum_lima.AAC.1